VNRRRADHPGLQPYGNGQGLHIERPNPSNYLGITGIGAALRWRSPCNRALRLFRSRPGLRSHHPADNRVTPYIQSFNISRSTN
jgi:hypothetical protein